MELNDFIEKFAEQFDDTELSELKPETEFKLLDEWSSLTALSIIAMVDEEYDVAVPATEIIPANFNSAQAIYDMIQRLK